MSKYAKSKSTNSKKQKSTKVVNHSSEESDSSKDLDILNKINMELQMMKESMSFFEQSADIHIAGTLGVITHSKFLKKEIKSYEKSLDLDIEELTRMNDDLLDIMLEYASSSDIC